MLVKICAHKTDIDRHTESDPCVFMQHKHGFSSKNFYIPT